MKVKRLLALVLAVMLVSSTVLTSGTISALAVEGDTSAAETTDTSADSNTTDDKILTSEDVANGSDTASGYVDADSADSADSTGTNGVIAGEDAADAELDAVDGTTSGIAEQVDRDSIDVDLTSGGVEDETLSEDALYDDDEMVKVIIEFVGDSVVEANSEAEPNSTYAKTKIRLLERKQDAAITEIEDDVLDGESLDITYQYTWVINAVATEVPYGSISEIEALDSVEQVYIQELYSAVETTDSDDTLTIGSGSMIGKTDTWAEGYTGKGIKIAIIDTGLDTDHPSFSALDESALTWDSATEASVASVLTQLNAYSRYLAATGEELEASDVYYSTKIAFGFNYCDDSLDVTHDNDSEGDHGTHVAGIAAANETEGTDVVGVAPDAQIYVMKVFGQLGGAYTEDIIAGIEDALLLDADVINMSLGSDAGFTASGNDVVDQVYETVATTSTILAVSAGNSGTMGEDNLLGGSLTSNPDNGLVSSPSTYANALSVASVDNASVTGYYAETEDGTKIAYEEGSNGTNDAMSTLFGQTLEFVMIGGYGEESDYADVDVTGKIAVVSRGSTSFVDKQAAAANAGAVGILVYNNVTSSISADLSSNEATIPFATISMSAGAYLQTVYDEAVAAGEAATLYFASEMASIESDTGYQMSSFSSWGTTGDLKIEPDVTAPGGSIYSTLDGGTYGIMSGTSMSSPQISGIAALIQQYVQEKYDLSDADTRTMITALLLSTATPLSYDEDTYYSPRQQGSGLANAYNAVTSTAYLTVDGTDEPQAEVGDDPDKTGSFSYTFNVVNIGDTTLYYDISTSVQTEDYTTDDSGAEYMATTPVNLDADTSASGSAVIYTYDYDESGVVHSHDARLAYLNLGSDFGDELFRYDLTSDDDVTEADVQAYLDALVGKNDTDLDAQVVCVKADTTATVTVSIQVSQDSMDWMDAHFDNGIYVEGFTVLTAKNAGVDLALPYLGFYGSWSQAPMIDGGYYYMDDDELNASSSQYYNYLWSNYAGYDGYWVPGFNPYVDEEFDASHISISPNGDGYADNIGDIYVSLLRNAEELTFTFADASDAENVYTTTSFEKVIKSIYYSSYGICLPFVYSWYADGYAWDGTDADGNTLANNAQAVMTIYADLGYDSQTSNVSDTWTETITIDTEAPTLDLDEANTYITINEDGTQTLTLTFADNVDVAAVNFVNKAGAVKAQYAVEHPDTKGEYVTASYDITGYGNSFYVILGDYAFNESAYLFTTTDNLPEVDTSLLYGFRTYDTQYSDDTLYGWVSMNTDEDDFTTEVLDSEYYLDYAITAATYVDGYIMAIAADNKLYAITPGLWDEWTYVADLDVAFRTMTYDPVEECLWAYSGSNYALYRIDILTGEATQVGSGLYSVTAIAADDDGTLYAVNTGGYLRTINKTTGAYTADGEDGYLYCNMYNELKELTGLTYPSFSYQQSMVYDAADDCLYWAAFSYGYYGTYGGLIRLQPDLDSNSVTLTSLGTIEGDAEIVGLLKIEDRSDFDIPDEAELESIALEESGITVLIGGSQTLTALYDPWYAASSAVLTWSSDDESIASVDSSGKVTGVSVGTATITVSALDGTLTATCTVNVVDPDAELFGFAAYGYNSLYYQWITLNASAPSAFTTLTGESILEVTAGEYYDGSIYAFSSGNDFYRIDPETFEATKLGSLSGIYGYNIYDMAYDYSTGFLYGIDDYGYLYAIDMLNGEAMYVGYLEDSYYGSALTLAISTEGTIYYITSNGFLCTYDPETDTCADVGLTGVTPTYYFQSMTYDHNDGGIYWADTYGLYYVDTSNGKALYLGAVDGAMTQLLSLYTVIDEENVPERAYVPVTEVNATADSVTLLEGMTASIPTQVLPYNATNREISWTVADESVATVANGVITGVAFGETTITGTLSDNGTEYEVTITVNVKKSTGDLYAYILYDMSGGDSYFWGKFQDNGLENGGEVLAYTEDYAVYGGEYYDGKIYASGIDYTEGDYNAMFAILDAETFEVELYLTNSSLPTFSDMAFDYSTGTLYAVGGQRNSDVTYLYMIDTRNGDYYTVGQTDASLVALACSTDGTLYSIDDSGCFYTVDKNTAELTYVGYTGYTSNQYNSLAYDHDTGNLYWAECGYDWSTWSTTCDFLLVDPDTGSVSKLGTIGASGCQAVSLFSIPENPIEIGSTEPTAVALSNSSEVLTEGDTLQLTATLMPVSVLDYEGTITFSSSDPTVATVDETGLVTAVSKGTATITASCGDLSGSCQIIVVDDSLVFYAMNATGFDVSPVYSPDTVNSSVSYPDDITADIAFAAYSSEDGVFYALDVNDDLWSFQYDAETGEFSAVTQITTETSIIDAIESTTDLTDYGYTAEAADLVLNTFNNKLYVMAAVGDYYDWMDYFSAYYYYIYEVDTTTGAVTMAGRIDAGTPDSFVFTSANTIVWYDYYSTYMYSQELSQEPNDEPTELAWLQNDFWNESGHDYDGHLSMVYSESLNRIYLAGEEYYNGYGLYEFNLATNRTTQIGSAVYDDAFDLILFE